MTPSRLRSAAFGHASEFETAWLSLRRQHVTSTQCAALFGLHPRLTPYELWNIKAGTVADEFEPTERTEWGLALQDSIAAKVGKDRAWTVQRFDDYLYDADDRMGASYDFLIDEAGVRKHVEVKNVDGLIFRNQWREVDGLLEAPDHIELQHQQQYEVMAGDPDFEDVTSGYIVALIGGNRAVILPRERDAAVGSAIRQKVREFWRSIADSMPPPVTMPDDAALVAKLHRYSDGSVIEADPSAAKLIADYHAATAALNKAESDRDAIKAAILQHIGLAAKVLAGDFSLSATQVADHPGTLVTEEMVGTYVGRRSGYRRFQTYQRKPKGDAA